MTDKYRMHIEMKVMDSTITVHQVIGRREGQADGQGRRQHDGPGRDRGRAALARSAGEIERLTPLLRR